MKRIRESKNKEHWPRRKCEVIKCRSKDLVIRITDWSKDKDEPGYDVEVYIGGVYDWNESKTCTVYEYISLALAKRAAINFAQAQVYKLL